MSSSTFTEGRAELDEVLRFLSTLERQVLPSVIATALNGAAREIRKSTLEKVKAETGVKPRNLSRRAVLIRAGRNKHRAGILWGRRKVNLARVYKVKQSKEGVTSRGELHERAFLAPAKYSRVVLVFRRAPGSPKKMQGLNLDLGGIGDRHFRVAIRADGPRLWRKHLRAKLKPALERRGHLAAAARITE